MKRTRFRRLGKARHLYRETLRRRMEQTRPAFLSTPQEGRLPTVDSVPRAFPQVRLVIRDQFGRGVQF